MPITLTQKKMHIISAQSTHQRPLLRSIFFFKNFGFSALRLKVPLQATSTLPFNNDSWSTVGTTLQKVSVKG